MKILALLLFSNILICNNLFSGDLFSLFLVSLVLLNQSQKQDYFLILFMLHVNLEATNLSREMQ